MNTCRKGRIRTYETIRHRFTVCRLRPLSHLPFIHDHNLLLTMRLELIPYNGTDFKSVVSTNSTKWAFTLYMHPCGKWDLNSRSSAPKTDVLDHYTIPTYNNPGKMGLEPTTFGSTNQHSTYWVTPPDQMETGLEPVTYGLWFRCSTIELLHSLNHWLTYYL